MQILSPVTSATAEGDFKWSGAGTALFGGGSPSKGAAGGEDDDDENVDPEAGPDIHFEPIVQLPEVTDLKTGEEDEAVVFRHRAKLYRFDGATSQWKERGVGEMKILKNLDTGMQRLFWYLYSSILNTP